MRNTFNFFKKKLNLLLVLNVVMCVMVLLNAFCICWTSYRNGHLGLLTQDALLLFLNPWRIVKMKPVFLLVLLWQMLIQLTW